jgi:hypothetical protein
MMSLVALKTTSTFFVSVAQVMWWYTSVSVDRRERGVGQSVTHISQLPCLLGAAARAWPCACRSTAGRGAAGRPRLSTRTTKALTLGGLLLVAVEEELGEVARGGREALFVVGRPDLGGGPARHDVGTGEVGEALVWPVRHHEGGNSELLLEQVAALG